MVKTVRIKFVNFWQDFGPADYPFKDILEKKYRVELSDDPEYIFYSALDRKHPYEYAKYDGVRIFYTGELFCPDFTAADYAIGIDYINFDDRYIRYPQFVWQGFSLEDLERKHETINDDILDTKEYFCNFIYSNGECCPERKGLFDLLNSYKKVLSPGKFLNNTGPGFIDDDIYSRSKFSFMAKCKFSIACENFPYRGYLTEKLFHALGSKTVPVYFGDSTVGRDINTRGIVNAADYPSMEAVLERVKEIDNDDGLYLGMLKERVFNNGGGGGGGNTFTEKSRRDISNFLYNIFDQDYKAAFRRPRVMHSLYHERCLKNYNALTGNFWIKAINKVLRIYRR